jgi:hypothetical protein
MKNNISKIEATDIRSFQLQYENVEPTIVYVTVHSSTNTNQ